jgi:hypothetical protein
MNKDKRKFEIVDKLIIHLSQSFAYMAEHDISETLAYRMKKGKITKEDEKYIKHRIRN